MAMLVKHIVLGVFCFISILALYLIFIHPMLHFETRARFIRASFLLAAELFMSLMSYILWTILKPLPSYFSSVTSQYLSNGEKKTDCDNKSFVRKSLPQQYSTSSENSVPVLWRLFLGVFILMAHCCYLTNLVLSGPEPPLLFRLCFVCFGTLLQFNFGFLLVKVASFSVQKLKNVLGVNKNAKPFSQKLIVGLTLCYTFSASILGIFTAAQLPSVVRIAIPIEDLSQSLRNFHIVQLSDIHLGPTVGKSRLDGIVDIVNSLDADVVVITGDLVDGSANQLKQAAQPLQRIRSNHGAFFVSGNHEYYTGDVDAWYRLLHTLNVKFLHSSSIRVPPNQKEQLCIAGTNDLQADKVGYGNHTFDVGKAVSKCTKEQPVILLVHQPNAAKKALDMDVRIDAVLCGHTHAGQMFPLSIFVYLHQPFFKGLYQYKNGYVYVSSGTVFWGIPMRIGTTMEISSITLTSK